MARITMTSLALVGTLIAVGACQQPSEPGQDSNNMTEGGTCGGIIGQICDEGSYCELTDGCGYADQGGTCKVIPEICSKHIQPVCGCDDNTYGNDCEAASFGVNVQHEGPCGQLDSVVIDESGADQTFDVFPGQQVIVRLAGNPTTGYAWTVVSSSRTFGYPAEESFVPDDVEADGSGGIYEFVWETVGELPLMGAHTVVLEYGRSRQSDPDRTFTFTVNILGDLYES